MKSPSDVIFLTAADQQYSRSLYQLLRAAERTGWQRAGRWVVYDMQIAPDRLRQLQDRFDWVEWRKLPLADLPEHYVPANGHYAFKPYIVNEAVQDASGPVIWMDSANLMHGPADELIEWTREKGLYLLRGQTRLADRCEASVLDLVGVPGWTRGARERVSGVIGLNAAMPRMRKLAADWAKLAEDANICLPKPPTIERHMHDQALLNALVWKDLYEGDLELPSLDVDISSGRPVSYLSTRNKVGPDTPFWADPFVRAWYRTWKALDQLAHRIDGWHGRTKVFARMRSEYFEVRMDRQMDRQMEQPDGPKPAPKPLKSPFWHYYADPFLIEENGKEWVVFEDYNYRHHRATIAARPVEGGAVTQILDPGCHTSFPFMFRHNGGLFMLPETCRMRTLDVYECTRFPDQWTLRTRILEDEDAADSVIFEHGGRWWLITSLESPDAGGMFRYLAIFHAPDPVNGPWTPHPVNREGREINAPRGTARNAGGVMQIDGKLIRAVQVNRDYYGQGMELREITQLTETEFGESTIKTPDDLPMVDEEGVHHLSCLNGLRAWDKRLRY